MPYEVVQYPNTSPEVTGTEVTVHWSRDSHVQLEVVRHVWAHQCRNGCDGVTSGCDECPRGTTDEFNKAKSSARDVGELEGMGFTPDEAMSLQKDQELLLDSGDTGPARIWTQVLSRQEINKLIRVLRRARDQAYGEDA